MAFKPTQRLNVTRTLSTGERVAAGVLAQNRQGVFGDCLPDGCGLLLQDRVFRQQGIAPTQLTAMDRLATQAGFTDWKQALPYVQETVDVLSSFSVVAKHLGARASTIDLITKRLNQAWRENKGLLST